MGEGRHQKLDLRALVEMVAVAAEERSNRTNTSAQPTLFHSTHSSCSSFSAGKKGFSGFRLVGPLVRGEERRILFRVEDVGGKNCVSPCST